MNEQQPNDREYGRNYDRQTVQMKLHVKHERGVGVMTDHKIVCWGDYAIPVPVISEWIAWDSSGAAFTYLHKPDAGMSQWIGGGPSEYVTNMAPPPEPGPWHEQLYWIGD